MTGGDGAPRLCGFCGSPLPSGRPRQQRNCSAACTRKRASELWSEKKSAEIQQGRQAVQPPCADCGAPLVAPSKGKFRVRCKPCAKAHDIRLHQVKRRAQTPRPRRCKGCKSSLKLRSPRSRQQYCESCRRRQDQALSRKKVKKAKLRKLRVLQPKTRGDCVGTHRPCPWMSCRYHLLLDRHDEGHKLPRLGRLADASDEAAQVLIERWAAEAEIDSRPSCVLDVAAQGGCGPHRIAEVLGLCHERVRQILNAAMAKIGPEAAALGLELDDQEATADG